MNELELMRMREESRRNLAADLTEQNRAMRQFEKDEREHYVHG